MGILSVGMFSSSIERNPLFSSLIFPLHPNPHVCVNSNNERVDFFMSEMAELKKKEMAEFFRKRHKYICMDLSVFSDFMGLFYKEKASLADFPCTHSLLCGLYSSKAGEGG